MTITRRKALKGLSTAGIVGLAGCGSGGDGTETTDSQREATGTTSDGDENADVRAAFVYHDAIGDFGWQWAHDQARRAVDSEFDWLETVIYDNTAPESSKPRFRQYAERGFDIIFGTSWDYMNPMDEVAQEYPAVRFENCSGFKHRENMGRYFGRMYEPRYLTGVAAGLLTEANDLGYVAAFPISEVIRGINAFALGAASVNDAATIHVEYTETWNDAAIEGESARRLVDEGVDVMAQHQNYPAAAEAADDAGIWATGYNSPMGELVGENYVTSPIWDWEVFYRETVSDVRNGTWVADFYWEGLDSGVVDLSDWGPKVPDEVKASVDEKRVKIQAGELDVWAGSPFADYNDDQLFESVDQYVENVAGAVPSGTVP
jgi:basic membrane protein A